MTSDDSAFCGIPFRDVRITFLCYLAAHGGILLIPNAIYWDDWTLWNTGSANILDTFRQLGSLFNFFGYLHVAMLAIGPWAYRVLTFFLMYASGFLLYRILELHKWIRNEDRLLIVILFLVSPFYAARVALIDFPYSFCLFLFFLGWYFIGKNRVISLACFFLSFNMESLLVFYLLPVVDYFLRENRIARPYNLIAWGFQKVDFIATPFIWFAIKLVLFKPFGIYAGYNESFRVLNLLRAPVLQAKDLLSLSLPISLLLISAIVCGMAIKRLGIDLRAAGARELRNRYIAIGLLALLAGLFPYWILGDVPTFSEWTSRHQILMPLGAAFLFLGILACCEEGIKPVFWTIYIGAFLALNWSNYAGDVLDWQKQKTIVNFLRSSKDAAAAHLLIFEDSTPNALSRVYRFYEWGGLIKLAYSGGSDKFGINSDQLDQYLRGDFDQYFSVHFNAEEHRRTCRDMLEVIIQGNIFKQVIRTVGVPAPSQCVSPRASAAKETIVGR
jgi:hypothetical protein